MREVLIIAIGIVLADIVNAVMRVVGKEYLKWYEKRKNANRHRVTIAVLDKERREVERAYSDFTGNTGAGRDIPLGERERAPETLPETFVRHP